VGNVPAFFPPFGQQFEPHFSAERFSLIAVSGCRLAEMELSLGEIKLKSSVWRYAILNYLHAQEIPHPPRFSSWAWQAFINVASTDTHTHTNEFPPQQQQHQHK